MKTDRTDHACPDRINLPDDRLDATSAVIPTASVEGCVVERNYYSGPGESRVLGIQVADSSVFVS